jgi:hypothetical protein
MRQRSVDLVYFAGCPHAALARENIAEALAIVGRDLVDYREWDLLDATTPDRFRGFGSPSVLVDDEDVAGVGPTSEGMSCRAGGPPSVTEIADALGR